MNDKFHISWHFLVISKIISGLERPEPIPRGNIEGEESTSGFDDNDSNHSKVGAHDSGNNSDEKPHNGDGSKAWEQMDIYLAFID